jgi:hypothetical protein
MDIRSFFYPRETPPMRVGKQKFDHTLLDRVILRDRATLVGEYEKLNRETKIKFLCKCGVEYEKGFRVIFKHGACCKKCTLVNLQSKSKNTSLDKYGTEHPQQNKEVRRKAENTCINKYGVKSHNQASCVKQKKADVCLDKYGCKTNLQTDENKEKVKQTNLQNYGVEYATQNSDVKAKTKQTCIDRFGCTAPAQNQIVQVKMKTTTFKRYGVENASQSAEVQKKIVATCLDRYGTERPAQSQEFQIKNQNKAYKRKEFVMPSGEIRKHQGYEHFGLRDLLAQGYTEERIKSNREDIPRILYDCNGKTRAYFPDVFLPHENKIIEIKSTRTFGIDWEKKLKYQKKAVEEQGYVFEIWVYEKKGRRVDVTTSV